MYDYKIKTELENGKIKVTTYQKMVEALGIGSEIVHGSPLSEGGTPQVQTVIHMIKDIMVKQKTPVKSITAYYQDQPILSA